MSGIPHGGFVVTASDTTVMHKDITESTVEEIIRLLAILSPKVAQLDPDDIKSISIFTSQDVESNIKKSKSKSKSK